MMFARVEHSVKECDAVMSVNDVGNGRERDAMSGQQLGHPTTLDSLMSEEDTRICSFMLRIKSPSTINVVCTI